MSLEELAEKYQQIFDALEKEGRESKVAKRIAETLTPAELVTLQTYLIGR